MTDDILIGFPRFQWLWFLFSQQFTWLQKATPLIFSVAVLGQKHCKTLHNILHMLRQILPQITSQVISLTSQRLQGMTLETAYVL